MAGYVARVRVDRALPRFRLAHASLPRELEHRSSPTEPLYLDLPENARPAVQDLSGAAFAAGLVDFLADIRQVWRQGLEILADPQGWRS